MPMMLICHRSLAGSSGYSGEVVHESWLWANGPSVMSWHCQQGLRSFDTRVFLMAGGALSLAAVGVTVRVCAVACRKFRANGTYG